MRRLVLTFGVGHMKSLAAFQHAVAQTLTVLALAHVPLLGLFAAAIGRPVWPNVFIAAALATAPVLAMLLKRPTIVVAIALCIALIGQTSLLVFIFDGHPWQVEMHFYYFTVLALLSGFCEWPVLVVAAGLIALHHLSLNFLLPSAIYPGGADLFRVGFHAAVVIVETAMLIRISIAIRGAFTGADAAQRQVQEAAEALAANARERERELAATTYRADRLAQLLSRFQHEITESTDLLYEAAQQLQHDADGLDKTAAQTNTQSATVVTASEQTAEKVQSAANAGDELAQTIAAIGSNAARSSQVATATVTEAAHTTATIDELAAVAGEIGKVTDLISSIARQTNLLALNATIEAARAGAAGRGFAVVAQEVKILAAQTASATDEIEQRINAMQVVTTRSVTAIQKISATIRELHQFSSVIADTVDQQIDATHAIAANVNAAAASVVQIGGAIGKIENMANEASRSANKLNDAAAGVTQQAQRIREQMRILTNEMNAVPDCPPEALSLGASAAAA